MSVGDARLYLLGHWLCDQLAAHPERDATDAGLAQAAREQANAWLESKPDDRSAWLAAEGWQRRTLAVGSSLFGRLALHFGAADESHRHGIIVRSDQGESVSTVLAVVREAGPRDSYLVYNPKDAGHFEHFPQLETLCQSPLLPTTSQGNVTLYWSTGAKPTQPPPVPVKSEPIHPQPSAPVRAKKPPASGAKKRTTTTMVTPSSPAKKPVSESGSGVVALVEESSGETAK